MAEYDISEISFGSNVYILQDSELRSALTKFIFPLTPQMMNGRLDANTGEPIEVGTSDRWISEDYFSAKSAISLVNNTSGGKSYIFYYTLNNGVYTFNEYVGTSPGTTTQIDQTKGTHIRLYSTHASSGRNVVLKLYVAALG